MSVNITAPELAGALATLDVASSLSYQELAECLLAEIITMRLQKFREVLEKNPQDPVLRELREKDKWSYPHDEDCPQCGRRQWALGPLTVDPMNPTDEEQETCGACGYKGGDE